MQRRQSPRLQNQQRYRNNWQQYPGTRGDQVFPGSHANPAPNQGSGYGYPGNYQHHQQGRQHQAAVPHPPQFPQQQYPPQQQQQQQQQAPQQSQYQAHPSPQQTHQQPQPAQSHQQPLQPPPHPYAGMPDPFGIINAQKLHSLVDLQKMIFIYNAVVDGWTVRCLDDGRFEFEKELRKVTSDVWMDHYLKDFVEYYLKLQGSVAQVYQQQQAASVQDVATGDGSVAEPHQSHQQPIPSAPAKEA